jgi:predicted house-cleaning noncanonical NTP pyrophosphatase (MazG superfamily)
LPGRERTQALEVLAGQRKLVRDNIPQIIRSKGLEPVTYTASTAEYRIRLWDRLRGEVEEFLASDNDPQELADILEVVYALTELAGTNRLKLEKLRVAKPAQRGGFDDRIIWTGNRPLVIGANLSPKPTSSVNVCHGMLGGWEAVPLRPSAGQRPDHQSCRHM